MISFIRILMDGLLYKGKYLVTKIIRPIFQKRDMINSMGILIQ